MIKWRKKLIAICSVVLLSTTLAACGDDEETEKKDDGEAVHKPDSDKREAQHVDS